MAEEKKRRKKRRANRASPLVSGPQFARHVYGGGYYLGPAWLGYSTAQQETQEGEAAAEAAGGGEGGVV